jgi:hypothetical protein
VATTVRQEEVFGTDHGVIHEAVVTGRKVGAGRDFWSALAHDEVLFRRAVKLVMGVSVTLYLLTVDYRKSIEQMAAAGDYDGSTSPNITAQNFPATLKGTARVEVEIVHLNLYASTDEVMAELDRRGLRAATMAELLSFGAKYPDVQREFPIVALGSVWVDSSGYRLCGYLWSDGDGRYCGLDFIGNDWNSRDRFLAVRK